MRMSALDGWRGIACLLVAIFHLNVAHSLYFLPIFQRGAPILEFFFVLSGFVISMVFADRMNDGRGVAAFLTRVVGRIYPLHWLTLAPLVLLASAKAIAGAQNGGFYGVYRLDALLPQIFNVQTWTGHGLTWNFPAWTLSGELAAYLVFALIMLVIGSRAGRIMASLLVIVVSGALFAAELGPRQDYNVISVARCFVGFFVGFVLFDIWRWRSIQTARTANVIEAVAVIGLLFSLHAKFDGLAYFLNYPLVALVVWTFASGKGVLSKAIANPVLLWLGKVSFSLYMIHAVIKLYITEAFYAAERLTGQTYYFWFTHSSGADPARLVTLGSAWANNLLLAAYLAAVFVCAGLLYRFVEEPTRRSSAQVAKALATAPEGAFSPARLWETLVARRKRA